MAGTPPRFSMGKSYPAFGPVGPWLVTPDELTVVAKHQAKWRKLTEDEEAGAVAALRELAGGRGDLLAYVAGILEGQRGPA
jgi:2,4-didehydro-3-deoxy-L-rhamnonate hydrolase